MAAVHQPDSYHVAVKAFFMDGDKVLLCRDVAKDWDLLGGRLNVDEFAEPFEDILRREIVEEVGDGVRFTIGKLACAFRVQRLELALGHEIRILMLGFDVRYESGDIQLSDEHSEYRWVPLNEAATLLPPGQAQGVTDYIAQRGR